MSIEKYFKWEQDYKTGFRKLILYDIKQDKFVTEKEKFNNYTGKTKKCSKCKEILPANTYFFASRGKGKLHAYCKKCESSKYGWGRNENKILNSQGFKYCSTCDRILPLNQIYFSISNGENNTLTGFCSNCKECIGNHFGIRSINNYKEVFNIKDGFKICTCCGLEIPNTYKFFRNREEREFGTVICRKCELKQLNKKSNTNREEIWYHPNMALKKLINNDECICTICLKVIKKKDSIYVGTTYKCKECYKKINIVSYEKRRNKIYKLKRTLTVNEWIDTLNYFDNKCAYCGMSNDKSLIQYNKNLAQEHIIPVNKGGAYIKENIIPACQSCNSSKSTKTLDEFFISKDYFTYVKYLKIKKFINDCKHL